jgi:large subunit ribosomal protein L21e
MVKRIGGFRRKTRHKLQIKPRQRGKLSLKKYFQKFEVGQKVLLQAEPSIQKGMYRPRFHGKVGTITAKKGTCYSVAIMDHTRKKILIVHPVHLESA